MVINMLKIRRQASSYIWYLTLVYYISITSINFFTGASQLTSVVLILIALLMLYIYSLQFNCKFNIKLDYFVRYNLAFTSFCFCSIGWAQNIHYSTEICTSILQISLVTILMNQIYRSACIKKDLFEIVMYGGYLISAICLFIMITNRSSITGNRLLIDGFNANTIGMVSAFSVLISIYYLSINVNKKIVLIMPLAICIMLFSGSRTAIIALLIGVIAYFTLITLRNKGVVYTILKILIFCAFIMLSFPFLSYIPGFDIIIERFQNMIMSISNNAGIEDNSTHVRFLMLEIGLNLFLTSPLVGIGINNPGLYAGRIIGVEHYYLHNNYIELLAGIGILGTLLFYSFYIYSLYLLIKYSSLKDKETCIIISLILIKIIMDFGMVSYSSKINYFILLLIWVKTCKKKMEFMNCS